MESTPINQQTLDLIWSIDRSSGYAPISEPVVVRSWMEYVVHHVISILRDEDLLHVRRATIEWNSGSAVVTSNTLSTIPMGTITVMADEWREEVGA
jgi:hypothetical protein